MVFKLTWSDHECSTVWLFEGPGTAGEFREACDKTLHDELAKFLMARDTICQYDFERAVVRALCALGYREIDFPGHAFVAFGSESNDELVRGHNRRRVDE